MKLDDVMNEVALVLSQITGLQVFPYPPEDTAITPPAGYVSYPQSIEYDETYARGQDRFTDLPFVLVARKNVDRVARDTLAGWASGGGQRSIKKAMEAWSWVSCDDVTVNSCEFDVEKIQGVNYLAVLFKATVVGPGEED